MNVVKAMLSRDGIDVNQAEWRGITPLHVACIKGHVEVVKTLLSGHDVDVNQGRKNGQSPLYAMCEKPLHVMREKGATGNCECSVEYERS